MLDKNEIIKETLEKLGYSKPTIQYLGKCIYREWYGDEKDKYSLEEKLWAYNRGYTAEMAKALKLNETNHKDFINVTDYHLLDPIDPVTKRLIDGKLTIHYSIGGQFPDFMPKYYSWINENGEIIHLDDGLKGEYNLADYLLKIVDKFEKVAIKPLAGTGGIGFLKLEKILNHYYANNVEVTNFVEQAKLVNNQYVVTEYIEQCKEFREIWPNSAATLRIISINIPGKEEPKTFVSYVRFGTDISKGACNLASGGVAAPFDWNTGEFFGEYYRYAIFSEDGKYKYDKHPNSGVSLRGKRLPQFEKVKECVDKLSKYLAVHKYFGFDIIITDSGVKICEINSLPSLDYEQLMFGGIWKRNDEVSDFFRTLLKKKKQNVDEPIVIIPEEFYK